MTDTRKAKIEKIIEQAKNEKAVSVLMRTAPCFCGCKGSNPRHAKRFTRKVRDIKPHDIRITTETRDGCFWATVAHGEIRTPTCIEPVRLCVFFSEDSDYVADLGWEVDPDRCLIFDDREACHDRITRKNAIA